MNFVEHILSVSKQRSGSVAEGDVYWGEGQQTGMQMNNVYWSHNAPWSLERDTDFDGIPDALDYHIGPGAHQE